MEGFEWAERNLNVLTPHELQDDRGVQVYFAPNIPSDVKLVDLGTGRVTAFHDRERRPRSGYYADFESLRRYAERHDLPFHEESGLVTIV